MDAEDARLALLRRYHLVPIPSSSSSPETVHNGTIVDRIPTSIVSPKKRYAAQERQINITGHRTTENDAFLGNSLYSKHNMPPDGTKRQGICSQSNREEDIAAGVLGEVQKIGRFGHIYKDIVRVDPAASALTVERAETARKTPGYLDSLLAKAKQESMLQTRTAAYEQQLQQQQGSARMHKLAKTSDHEKSTLIQEARSAHRARNLVRFKQSLKGISGAVSRRRAAVVEDAQGTIATKKQIHLFRQKLQSRLIERNDPLATDFLRVFTEALAQRFLKEFNGCILTTDSVLSLIGGGVVGIRSLPPPQPTQGQSRAVEVSLLVESRRGKDAAGKGDDFVQQKKMLPAPALSNPTSRQSSRAGSAGERPQTRSTRRPATRSKEDKQQQEEEAARPRVKVRGGGFVLSKGASSPSKKREEGGGALLTLSGLTEGREEEEQRLCAAMAVMKTQLVAENKLPSRFPQKVLSSDQLLRLGLGETTFDDVFTAIKWREKARAGDGSFQVGSKEAPVERVMVSNSRAPPIALPTEDRFITRDTAAESPYAAPIGAESEASKIMCYGIASSGGLSLFSGKRVLPRKVLRS